MKKNTILYIAILTTTLLLILAACGGSSSTPSGSSTGGGGSTGVISPSSPSAGGSSGSSSASVYDEIHYTGEAQRAPGQGFSADGKDASAESATPADRKIIRNASLEIMARDASALYRNIVEYGEGIGGYEHSYSIANYESYSVIHAVFKVPPERLGAFVAFVGESGEIINSTMHSEDITDSYYDARTRLETKRLSLEQYFQLLKNASGIEEIVYLRRTIDSITEEIESLEGRLRMWNSQVDMSTVSLYIRQENDPLQIRKEISWNTLSADDMGYLIKRGFYTITNTIVSVLQWIIVLLIGYSPLWIILAAGAALWIVLRKRAEAKKTSAYQKKGEDD